MAFFGRIKREVQTDHSLQQARYYTSYGFRALPSATAEYFLQKVPIVHWLPKYYPKWILNDLIAGITVGIMLVPQGLAYAKIATIPVEFGLMSSWLPALIYCVMGTSKDLSTGPTSILGLLTAEIVRDFKNEGYTPQAIASAVAMCVGIWSLILGVFKLGFLMEFVSVPVLTGFISAAAIVIGLGQVPSLLGEDNVRTGTANIIHDVFTELPNANGLAVAVGLSGVVLLSVLQYVGKRWGKKSKIIWAIALSRAAIALVIYTGVSYALNKDRKKDPIFALSKVTSRGVIVSIPDTKLVGKVFARSIAPLVAAVLEHNAIGKAFGAKNGYVIDTTQELCYLGVTNLFNSWFSAMSVGGAMSRTAVNSESGVKSPLYGLFTGGVVLLGIYKLSDALYWIPKATLAAIVVTAVWHLIFSLPLYQFWRVSFTDFVACMLTFWITLFVSAEIGIAAGVAFSIAVLLLKTAFVKVTAVAESVAGRRPGSRRSPAAVLPRTSDDAVEIGDDVQVFALDSVLFPNSDRVQTKMLERVQVFNSGISSSADVDPATAKANRSWSVASERRIGRLRRAYGLQDSPPRIRVVVLDFARVEYIDTTGLLALVDFKKALKKFAGDEVEVRFVGMNDAVRGRFERIGWMVRDADEAVQPEEVGDADKVDLCFRGIAEAVGWERRVVGSGKGRADEIYIVGEKSMS